MTLVIDTGDLGPLRHIPDWFLDLCRDPADTARVYRSYAEHIVGQMAVPVKAATVRKHLVAVWPFLRQLADTDPAAFDWVITEYTERLLADACASAPGGSPADRRNAAS